MMNIRDGDVLSMNHDEAFSIARRIEIFYLCEVICRSTITLYNVCLPEQQCVACEKIKSHL